MIRVRYRGPNELSPGLHATAEREGRRTTVYLLDGMTAGQRQSALRRLRLTARMGHCPRLPAAQLAFALFTDRIRTGIGRAGAVLRLHPAGSTVPIMVLSGGAIAFLLFSTVSIHVLHRGPADPSAAGISPAASASPIATGQGPQGQAAGQGGPGSPGGAGNLAGPGGTGSQADPGGLGGGSDPRQLTRPGRGSSGTTPAPAGAGRGGGTGAGSGSGSSGSGGTSGTGSGGTTLSGGSNPSQVTPQPSTPATSAPAPPASTAPAAAPTPSGSGSGSSSGSQNKGVCVNVGPLGVCLSI